MRTNLTATEWAAIIGALAWVPQIITWVRDYFAKPTLALFPAAAPEIGFSTFGMVLNLPCAISATVTDAVIERMEVELTHERGEKTLLPWRGLHETLAEIETATGEVERHKRQQTALALKVLTEELTEKVVMFQDIDFQARLADRIRAVESRRDRIGATETAPGQSALVLKSDEFAQMDSTIRSGCLWQPGSYDATFRIKAAERTRPFEFSYSFQMSETDVARLRENIEHLVTLLTGIVAPEKAVAEHPWNWRYPALIKNA